MPRTRQTRYAVWLAEEERTCLRPFIGQGTAPARRITHALILLKADQGDCGPAWADAATAGAVHPANMGRVRNPYPTDVTDDGQRFALGHPADARLSCSQMNREMSAHVNVDHLNGIVPIAEAIPGRDIRLHIAGGIGRAGTQ